MRGKNQCSLYVKSIRRMSYLSTDWAIIYFTFDNGQEFAQHKQRIPQHFSGHSNAETVKKIITSYSQFILMVGDSLRQKCTAPVEFYSLACQLNDLQ